MCSSTAVVSLQVSALNTIERLASFFFHREQKKKLDGFHVFRRGKENSSQLTRKHKLFFKTYLRHTTSDHFRGRGLLTCNQYEMRETIGKEKKFEWVGRERWFLWWGVYKYVSRPKRLLKGTTYDTRYFCTYRDFSTKPTQASYGRTPYPWVAWVCTEIKR